MIVRNSAIIVSDNDRKKEYGIVHVGRNLCRIPNALDRLLVASRVRIHFELADLSNNFVDLRRNAWSQTGCRIINSEKTEYLNFEVVPESQAIRHAIKA